MPTIFRTPLIVERPKPQVRPVFQPGNLLVTTLAVPFRQADWPNPSRQKARQESDTANLLLTTLASILEVPFTKLEWPNPRITANRQPDAVANFLLTTLESVLEVPFAVLEWPNPPRGYALARRAMVQPETNLLPIQTAAAAALAADKSAWRIYHNIRR